MDNHEPKLQSIKLDPAPQGDSPELSILHSCSENITESSLSPGRLYHCAFGETVSFETPGIGMLE